MLTASELPSTHSWALVRELSFAENKALKRFQDAMYRALDKEYVTQNQSRVNIGVSRDVVENISGCFARAGLLDVDLAKQTESFFVEWPNRLLTVAVPTHFIAKPPLLPHGNNTYAFYHKTEWSTVPKILVERMIRPADWSRDADGVPQQFPSYGPFGASVETGKMTPPMTQHTANQLSNSLFRIGKGQLSAGIFGYFQCPQMTKHQAGGNDQIQRGAMLNGGSKNDHATVARSDILTVAYVATTQVLPHEQIYWIQRSAADSLPNISPPDQSTASAPPASPTHFPQKDIDTIALSTSMCSRRWHSFLC